MEGNAVADTLGVAVGALVVVGDAERVGVAVGTVGENTLVPLVVDDKSPLLSSPLSSLISNWYTTTSTMTNTTAITPQLRSIRNHFPMRGFLWLADDLL